MGETLKCFINGCESRGSGVVCAPCFIAERARADKAEAEVENWKRRAVHADSVAEDLRAQRDALREAMREIEEGDHDYPMPHDEEQARYCHKCIARAALEGK